MPRVHMVKKARKDNPAVKRGESYYYWTTRMTVGKRYVGQKHYSKTYPKRSQLTGSGFLATMYDIEDRLSGIQGDSREDLSSELEDIRSELENLQSETQDNLDNMPEQLQEDSIPQKRIDEIESMVSELEGINCEDEDMEVEDLIGEISGISYGGE